MSTTPSRLPFFGPVRRSLLVVLPVLLFLAIHFSSWRTPGVYMDAVNPDYIVVRFLDSMNQNFPVWVMPGNLIAGRFPLLVQFYHGSLPYYLGLPTYLVFGTGLFGIRVTGALFGVSILFALLVFARGLKVPVLAAAMGLLVLATDPAFILGLRTQFYIKMIPAALVIAAIGTIAGNPSPKRAFIAGVLAGLAVHGYFIHAFPAAAITAVVLVWPGLGNRARLAWIGGIALGFLPSVIGITLVYLRVGDWEGFREFIGGAVQAQSPGQSSLGLLERASAAIGLANLAWQGFAAQLMALQETLPMPASAVLKLGLAIVIAVLVFSLVSRPGFRLGSTLIMAATLGFLALGLAFGDRLWAHHFSPVTLLFAAAATLTFATLVTAGRLGVGAAVLLGLALIGANLAGWRMTFDALQTTGGRGLSSDAIIRFAEDIGARDGGVAVAPVDWGVFMPLAMVTRGSVPLNTEFDVSWIRGHLCAGRDVAIPLIAGRQPERLTAWTSQLAVGAPSVRQYVTRDGRPVLEVFTWPSTRDAC